MESKIGNKKLRKVMLIITMFCPIYLKTKKLTQSDNYNYNLYLTKLYRQIFKFDNEVYFSALK